MVAVVAAAGTTLLGASFATRPGSFRFYALTLATAATWAAGGLLSGLLHRGKIENHSSRMARSVVVPVATGAGAFGIFCCAAVVAHRVAILDHAVDGALTFAERGSGPLVLLTTCANGLGEEIFFRGALYAVLPPASRVAGSTAAYTFSTSATRNPALVLAAATMGTLFGLQRRASQGVQAPLLTHLTWSILMVTALPRVFHGNRTAPPRRPS